MVTFAMPRKLTDSIKKRRILKVLGETDNLSQALTSALCTREDYRRMVSTGTITAQELQDALASYSDRILAAAHKAVFDIIDRPLVRYGKVVTDSDGNPLKDTAIDAAALAFLMQRIRDKLDGQARGTSQEHSEDSIPASYRIVYDARDLTHDELLYMKMVAERIEREKAMMQGDKRG